MSLSTPGFEYLGGSLEIDLGSVAVSGSSMAGRYLSCPHYCLGGSDAGRLQLLWWNAVPPMNEWRALFDPDGT